jgi:hypothetical protein
MPCASLVENYNKHRQKKQTQSRVPNENKYHNAVLRTTIPFHLLEHERNAVIIVPDNYLSDRTHCIVG